MRGLWLFSLLLSVHAEDATLTVSPAWSPLYVGERVHFKCDMNEGDENSWFYKLNRGSDELFPYNQSNTFSFKLGAESASAEYQCVDQNQATGEIKYSNNITVTVKYQPRAELRAESRYIPVGGHVTLTCSVNPPSDWTYRLWYLKNELSDFSPDESEFINGQVNVYREGFYRCWGVRGSPPYDTYPSDPVHVGRVVTDKAVVTMDWPQVYYGESVMVRCEISGANTRWEYEWKTSTKEKPPPNLKEFRINETSRDHDGDYQCKGRTSGNRRSVTEWSDVFSFRVYPKPLPVLRASLSWWSPGSSLTLSCDVNHPSAGWKFYWYEEFRTSSDDDNTDKFLPMSINGTETATITINEPSHTAAYRCRAGRGDPIFYTGRSNREYVWSADDHHSVSLKVSPERAQHFGSDSFLMTCEGNATNSRVMRYTGSGSPSPCSAWGEGNGPVCNGTFLWFDEAVFYCESELGSSNAVNITQQYDDGIILVSPVYPVTEGESVTIGCQLRTGPALSNVSFYKDDKLVQSDGDAEMTISSVSKSDEGFYKCQSSGKRSPQSWILITSDSTPTPTPEGSSPHILLFAGLPVGLLFIILLLVLLFRYKKSKCVFFTRHDEGLYVNVSSAVAPPVHQRESHTYRSLLHAHEENIYETIEGREDTEEENPDHEYDDVAPPLDNDVITEENPDPEYDDVAPPLDNDVITEENPDHEYDDVAPPLDNDVITVENPDPEYDDVAPPLDNDVITEENPDPEYDDVAPPLDNDVITEENPDPEYDDVAPPLDNDVITEENPDDEYDDVAPPLDNDVITEENPDHEYVEVVPTSDTNGENP